MFPRAKSTFLFNADITPTTNSGNEVPKAINDNPITLSETLNMFERLIAELINKSDPYIRKIIPRIIRNRDKNLEYSF